MALTKSKNTNENFVGREKEIDTVTSNIQAAQGVSDFIRTSLGPKGMDKMITTDTKDVIISNDGATILKNLQLTHPIARMLVEVSKAQDIAAGDGTTSVVILAGALLEQAKKLIEKGLHPNIIAEEFRRCSEAVPAIIQKMATPISIDCDDALTNVAITSLSSKVVSSESELLAPIAVKAVRALIDKNKSPNNVDLNNIKIVSKVGGTIEDSAMINGLVFEEKASHSAGGPTFIKNAKIALIQFQLSAPKTNMDFSVSVHKNEEIDRINKEERRYIARMVQKIAKSGCNVLLIQKSILRDAVNSLSLHFLAKKKIMVVTNVERENVPFIAQSLGLKPIAAIDEFVADKLGSAETAQEIKTPSGSLIRITGVRCPGKAVSILLRASNALVLKEAERSLHDALCVVRSLVQSPATIPGGAAAEMAISVHLRKICAQFDDFGDFCQNKDKNCSEKRNFDQKSGKNDEKILKTSNFENFGKFDNFNKGKNSSKNASKSSKFTSNSLNFIKNSEIGEFSQNNDKLKKFKSLINNDKNYQNYDKNGQNIQNNQKAAKNDQKTAKNNQKTSKNDQKIAKNDQNFLKNGQYFAFSGAAAMCVEAFAEAMESIPFTLAENCGLNPVEMVTALRDAHWRGDLKAGIDVRRSRIKDLEAENVVQPVLVTLKAVSLATECVQMILKIDNIVQVAK